MTDQRDDQQEEYPPDEPTPRVEEAAEDASDEQESPRRIWDPEQRRWVSEDELRGSAPPGTAAQETTAVARGAVPAAAPAEAPDRPARPDPPDSAGAPLWLAALVAAAIGAVLAIVVLLFFPGFVDRSSEPAGDTQGGPVDAADGFDMVALSEGTRPAVVTVTVRQPAEARRSGSGVVLRSDGVIATSASIVEGAQELTVTFGDGQSVIAEVIGTDPRNDLAILELNGTDLTTILRTSAELVRVGEPVAIVASPTETFSMVSRATVASVGRPVAAEGRLFMDMIQLDVPRRLVPPGSAVVGADGSAIGLTVSVGGDTEAVYAVPMDVVAHVLEAVRGGGDLTHPYIGAATSPMPPTGLPADVPLVTALIFQGSPAAEAGLRPGDVIVEIDGEPVQGALSLMRTVLDAGIGQPITLTILRAGDTQEVRVVVAERPPDDQLVRS